MFKKILRIAVFLILGLVIRRLSVYYLPSPYSCILPPAALIVITFIMQTFIEHKKPSFFMAGNVSNSFTGGAVSAFMIYAVPLYILWMSGQLSAGRFRSDTPLRLVCALLDNGLLPSLLIRTR